MQMPTLTNKVLQEAGFVRDIHDLNYGNITVIGPLFRLGRSKVSPANPVPRCGEHSREVPAELGYTSSQIESFFQRKIIA
jgi:crotonobetainyl-CoA:carnitine CoA-transferase CaiB-like acyl-CoA transferase